jgi:O-antigen/teichoic acid export membrane protein
VDVNHPEQDQAWDRAARSETGTERLDRNWANLLQELRVTQTGVQLLTGFLLTLPFQQRFDLLDHTMRIVYLVTVGCSVAATVLLIAPVGMHRLLFRRHRLAVLVAVAHRCTYAGLVLLGLALVGVTVVVFDAVAGATAGIVAGAVALIAFITFWLVLPLLMRPGGHQPPTP